MTDKKYCPCCSSDETRNPSASADIKEFVRRTYSKAAKQVSISGSTSCCGSGTQKDPITKDLYPEDILADIPPEAAAASLGCANPLVLADLKPGEVVLDLGSGGGLDVLLSAKRVGPTGKAYGLDMTDEMLELARENQRKAGIDNAEFLKGEIENIPLPDASVDVIISNCVINLSPDKDKVIAEAYRVLKPGGRLAIADIVLKKPLSPKAKQYLALWAGCIAGALEIEEYKTKLLRAGFIEPEIEIAREYAYSDVLEMIPQDVANQMSDREVRELAESFVSAFVRAKKPGTI
ncbi:MAG: arsenite methyltransferase [Armatimonadota bacterium]|nr:arsenite methyltransferase [Armatimonadota bacterium]